MTAIDIEEQYSYLVDTISYNSHTYLFEVNNSYSCYSRIYVLCVNHLENVLYFSGMY